LGSADFLHAQWSGTPPLIWRFYRAMHMQRISQRDIGLRCSPVSVCLSITLWCRNRWTDEAGLKPNSITLVGSELVRSWFEPDSVMEFGFYGTTAALGVSYTLYCKGMWKYTNQSISYLLAKD